jgi:putative protease
MPNKLSEIEKFKNSDGFIVGIKDFSWFVPLELTIKELKSLVTEIKKDDKKIFVSINKLMYNQDIPLLKEYLLVMEQLDIDGIMYDDLAVFNLSKSLSLTKPLIWFGTHSFTNYYTANYWYNKGIKGGVLSTEITLDHIKEIREHTKMPLMMYGYGYLPMFVSARHLLSSYFENINNHKEDKVYHMYEEGRKLSYPTYEGDNGTIILSADIINTISELPIIRECVDYLILSSLNIPSDNFYNVYEHYIRALTNPDQKEILSEVNNMVMKNSPSKTDKGFLYKETVYKVKE